MNSPNLPQSDFITVVTGLPRSGTSMMMQMLAAGGLPVLTDGEREADDDNPRGYFEFEKIKNLREDNKWISEAGGKAVKIVAQLLKYLPEGNYRFILMQRDLEEVILSQRKMLDRSGKSGAKLSDEQLKGIFSKQLSQVEQSFEQGDTPFINVPFRSCIESPTDVAAKVNQFLELSLDENAMADVVQAKLYRQRR